MKIKINHLLLLLLILQVITNLIGALGPELGFDSLWYHLTTSKIFLERHSINPIPGNLLYWSGLPRLGELIYALGLYLWDERLPKLTHLVFGILSAHQVYLLAKKYFSKTSGLIATNLFYSTLLVGWLSTTSYIDLIVTFFLLLALNVKKWWAKAIAIILASATKLHAVVIGLAITLVPWGILGVLPFAAINQKVTGNFFYPFLENFGFESEWLYNGFWFWFSRPLRLFFDPIFRVGPIILILFIFSIKKPINKKNLYTLTSVLLIWWLGPGTGFGRFALFLLSLLSIQASSLFIKNKNKYLLFLVVAHSLLGIVGRAWANQKYLPVILHKQTKQQFLAQRLKFDFGDFYDIDNWFKDNIKPSDKVLVYNIHNLFYLDFPFDHESWATKNSNYTHILVGANASLPKEHGNLPLLYQNDTSQVKLYLNDQSN
jgi:hypothetical protein